MVSELLNTNPPVFLLHSGMVNTAQECFMADANTIGIDIDEPIADIGTGNNVVVPNYGSSW